MKRHGKHMKWLYIGCGAIFAASVAGLVKSVRRHREKSTDEIDGGVVKRYWADLPKVILSSEITSFHCKLSLLAACETEGLGHRVYQLDAELENGEVLVKYDWYERQGERDKAEYKADADFMVRLQTIVEAYDFAQYNGYYHSVSGLPDMYGESLHILYKSDERIDVYDNQSSFLPIEAVRELVMLFGANTKLKNK